MADKKDLQATEHHRFITETQVKSVLRRDKGEKADLTSWKIEDFTKRGDNFATIVTSIAVAYSLEGSDQTSSYVVKINKEFDFEDFKTFSHALFEKEKEFYEEIAPALNSELTSIGQKPLRVPKWIYSAKEAGRKLIFFEDLRFRGFKMVDRTIGMDVCHALLVLEEMARLHAASVLLQERYCAQDLSDKYPLVKVNWHNHSDKAERMFTNFFNSHFDNAIEMLQRIGGYEVAERWLVKHKSKSFDIYKRLIIRQAPYDVICHGDVWTNNIMFRYNDAGVPTDVMLLDWQVTRLASLATDLNHFMYTTIVGDIRKANISNFLTSYYSTFQQVLEASEKQMPYTPEELLQEYKDKSEFGLLFALFAIGIVLRPPEEMPSIDGIDNEEDMQKTMAEWRKGSLKTLDTNPLLRPRFLALFDDMMEYGIIT